MRRVARFQPVVAALLLLGFAAPARAQAPAKHTITHEDVWLMTRVGAPAVEGDRAGGGRRR